MEDQKQNTGTRPVDKEKLAIFKQSVEALKQLIGKEV
jgi:hypothetical protein